MDWKEYYVNNRSRFRFAEVRGGVEMHMMIPEVGKTIDQCWRGIDFWTWEWINTYLDDPLNDSHPDFRDLRVFVRNRQLCHIVARIDAAIARMQPK
jgi:hypothetical protein